MTNLLSMLELEGLIPVLAFVIFGVVFVVILSFAAKKAREDARRQMQVHRERYEEQQKSSTQSSSEYMADLRRRQAEKARAVSGSSGAKQETTHTHVGNTVVSNADGHTHKGSDEEEYYEEIVGSLGDVNDEGCPDLDGVRLIAHDVAYETESGERNYEGVAKAMVLGDILNNPRFKSPYRKK